MATYWENSCSFGLRFVSWYMYLIVSLVFSHLGFWSGNLFLIAPFPDLCLLVPPNANKLRVLCSEMLHVPMKMTSLCPYAKSCGKVKSFRVKDSNENTNMMIKNNI